MRRKDLAKVSMKQCGTTSFIQTSLPYGRPSQLNSSTNWSLIDRESDGRPRAASDSS